MYLSNKRKIQKIMEVYILPSNCECIDGSIKHGLRKSIVCSFKANEVLELNIFRETEAFFSKTKKLI